MSFTLCDKISDCRIVELKGFYGFYINDRFRDNRQDSARC
jgi:hypothetical protein